MSTIVRSWARTKLLIVAHERTVEFAQIVKPSGLSQPRYPCVVSGAILNAKKTLKWRTSRPSTLTGSRSWNWQRFSNAFDSTCASSYTKRNVFNSAYIKPEQLPFKSSLTRIWEVCVYIINATKCCVQYFRVYTYQPCFLCRARTNKLWETAPSVQCQKTEQHKVT